MSTSKITAFIVGATGKQGGAAITELLKLGPDRVHLRGLTRNASSGGAKALAAKGVELVVGDLEDKATLVKGLQGADAAFLMTTPEGKGGAEGEVTQGRTFIEAAKEAGGLKHLVFTSVGSAEQNTGIPHFESKRKVELLLEASGIPYTILRPVAFMENLPPQPGFGRAMALGLFSAALGDKKLQYVSTKDIGVVAALAIQSPEKYLNRAIPLAGDELTTTELLDAFERAQGVRPWKAWLPYFFIKLLPFDLKAMFIWFWTTGYNVDIAECRKLHPGILTVEEWVKEQGKPKSE